MKKYAILSNDYSAVVPEFLSYVSSKHDINSEDHRNRTFYEFDAAEVAQATSINSIFPGLTLRAVCHATVNGNAMFNHRCDQPLICIPLLNTESTVLHMFTTVEGAILQTDSTNYYLNKDCILENTIPLNGAILLRPYTPFKMESYNTDKISHVLVAWFHEDPSAYFT